MYTVIGKLKGVAPILFNRMTEASESSLATGSAGGKLTEDQRMEEALLKVYRGEQGIFLPSWTFKQVMLAGCKKAGIKRGKASLAPFLEATVFPDHELPFGKEAPDFIHEHWGRRPPKTGGACMIKRPAFREGWELSFRLSVVDDRIPAGDIRKSLDEAGLLVGMGSWRPEYGRFVVTEWSVS